MASQSENRRQKLGIDQPPSTWLHRCFVLLVCLVWPLIWIGGLVTTYDAGMAVPDWPGTYGYNMFLYPIGTWLSGPFDLFIEHGHRLLAALVGAITIVALIWSGVVEPRRWVFWLTAAALVTVIGQGVLGGLRVVLDQRTLAMLHGCVGPAFFALCTALAVVTSRWWWRAGRAAKDDERKSSSASKPIGRGLVATAAVLAGLCYLQLLLGAQLRHVQATMSPIGFGHMVLTHVTTAAVVWVVSAAVAIRLWRCDDLALSRPAKGLIGLVALQIALGLSTWVVNYGFPFGSESWAWAARYVIESKGFFESIIVTGHVATGSLLIACSVMLWLRAARLRGCQLSAIPLSDGLSSEQRSLDTGGGSGAGGAHAEPDGTATTANERVMA